MKIKQEHRTSAAESRNAGPDAGLRFGAFGVRRSAFGVRRSRFQRGSVLILALWISIGLVAVALYFANSMTYELRASDNRVNGLASEQAVEGAARYVGYVLSNYATNGAVPTKIQYAGEAVQVGDAHFWLIGRDPSGTLSTEPYFGLVDEASKLNLNRAGTNTLYYLPNMTLEFAEAIADWRITNSTGLYSSYYSSLGYENKSYPFETVDELRLVYGATMTLLAGDDANRNGVVETTEKKAGSGGSPDLGMLEYLTVYSRQPNFHSDGSSLTNVNSRTALQSLLQSKIGSSRASQIISQLGTSTTYSNLLKFYASSGMTSTEFAKVYNDITTSANKYSTGLVNVNTAGAPVLEALFEGLGVSETVAESAAQTLIAYRQQHSDNLGSITWIMDALGSSHTVIQDLESASREYLTTRSYQFTADVAAVGPFGRGYRRVKFVFDITEGTPKVIYRQDLGRLGWALGEKVRTAWVTKQTQ